MPNYDYDYVRGKSFNNLASFWVAASTVFTKVIEGYFYVVETRTVGARLIYFTSVLADFTIFPLGDFLHTLRGLQRLH